MSDSRSRGRAVSRYLPWLAAYALVMTAVPASLAYARRHVIANLGTAQARAEWQVWKTETEKQANSPGPVKRRKVRSDEPPALVLFRDHFGAIVAMSLTVANCFFAFLMIVVRGQRKSP